MKLTYHKQTFDLLGVTPSFDEDNKKLIANFEAEHCLQFPAALSEWYALVNNKAVLKQILPNEHSIVHFQDAFQNVPFSEYIKGSKPFYILFENQGVWHMAVQLINDNPQVFIRLNEVGEHWRLHANSFSDGLYAWAWDYEIMKRDMSCFIIENNNKKIENYLINCDEKGPETFNGGNTSYQGELFVRYFKNGKRFTVIFQR